MNQKKTNILKDIYYPGISICIPAYNEEKTIEQAVYDAVKVLNKIGLPGEILVLDDGSTDKTWEILQKLKKDVPNIQTLRQEINLGIAATFNKLYQWGSRELVFLYPADAQWRINILLDMLSLLDRYDLIVARRKTKHYTFGRQLVSWMYNALPLILFGTRTYDAGSLKLVRREIYDIPVISSGVFVEAERIVRAKRLGYRIGAVDVDHFPRNYGKESGAKFSLVIQSLVDAVKCWIDISILRN